MNLVNEENARNMDLHASLSKLESDIKSFSKILQKTSQHKVKSQNRKKNSSKIDQDICVDEEEEDVECFSISDIDSHINSHHNKTQNHYNDKNNSLLSVKRSPIKFKDLADAVIRRRRRRKFASLKKWDGSEIDEWIFSPDNDSMGHLALIGLGNNKERPFQLKNKISTVKIQHSLSETNLQYPSVSRQNLHSHSSLQSRPNPPRNLNLTPSEPDQVLNCLCSCLAGRPILRLFLIIMFNGVVSMMCSAIIVRIEKPAQEQRFKEKDLLLKNVREYETNITRILRRTTPFTIGEGFSLDQEEEIFKMLKEYEGIVEELYTYSDEIPWGILSAQSFITSIQTTTGNGDIVPMTTQGKIFTLIYATYGVPMFLWYIFKLGGLFRILVINAGYTVCRCFWLDFPEIKRKVEPGHTATTTEEMGNEHYASSKQCKANELVASLDARFHPSIIGGILLIFLLSISAFISHIENISYFDSVYASFISYSTIGFGDIDIFQYSFRSNWFNFFIYGNGVHIIGYMIVSAYVTSILEKFGVRKF
uniref:Potassium channel domain-containing protein n=2 Tax=Lepeophtheirus salmonis TaxID=72036 RepID=A0A0K2UQ99_LEPSM